jgi:antitoxin CcdA
VFIRVHSCFKLAFFQQIMDMAGRCCLQQTHRVRNDDESCTLHHRSRAAPCQTPAARVFSSIDILSSAMDHPNLRDAGRKPAVVISSAEAQITKAPERGVGMSSTCEGGIESDDCYQSAKRWQDDNAAGFAAWNAYVERNGVPLAKYRKFATATGG